MSEAVKDPLCPRILFVIARDEDDRRVTAALNNMHLNICHQVRGQGTAPSEWLEICGLSGTVRIITTAMMPKSMTPYVMDGLRRALNLDKRGKGIAFTVPLSGLQGGILRMLLSMKDRSLLDESKEDDTSMASNVEYSMLCVSVNSGFSGDVVEAARNAGARGGTVIKGIRHVEGQTGQFMGVAMQEEQDIVLIITSKDKRQEMMSAISTRCGMKTPAQGIVVSMPVDETLGLQ